MKIFVSVSFSAAVLLSAAAFAEPISLSDKQMDGVTAGNGANNVAFLPQPWGALSKATPGRDPFAPTHHAPADNGIVTANEKGAQANGLPPVPDGEGGYFPCNICGVIVPR